MATTKTCVKCGAPLFMAIEEEISSGTCSACAEEIRVDYEEGPVVNISDLHIYAEPCCSCENMPSHGTKCTGVCQRNVMQ